ncbi:hypothetical protein BU25DRAFT_407778 [Macroventuria anomochaeta]|uniref:Uncharacterized protein n=1 Tax=Macroventuria anomochaeta TaxID=301207 RepID=A0ACB6SCC5_9PLEO|nr:uncharacterized protein BU25DRAFT_407778 [Macroventuria anomochaeta]KAF2631255.1 hypothetical protein BU25DRAFT_407778 [Macroventuria anomochaeta]
MGRANIYLCAKQELIDKLANQGSRMPANRFLGFCDRRFLLRSYCYDPTSRDRTAEAISNHQPNMGTWGKAQHDKAARPAPNGFRQAHMTSSPTSKVT